MAERAVRRVRTEVTATTLLASPAGDRGALTALYDAYGARCFALAKHLLGDEGLAAQAVQDVFLAVWRGAAGPDPRGGTEAGWLLTLTHRTAVDAVRRDDNGRGRRTPAELLDEVLARPVTAPALEGVARADAVRVALSSLPPSQREPLVLAYFGGYTQSEIAELTQTPPATVRTRMLSGMRRLRGALQAPVPGADDQESTG